MSTSPEFDDNSITGVSEELADEFAVVDSGTDVDVDAALAAAAENHRAEWAEFATRVSGEWERCIVVGGEVVVLVPGRELVVGRRAEVVVDHPLVSRRHVGLVFGDDGIVARDLGSANGTWLVRGGERVQVTGSPVGLAASDRIVTADDVELVHVPGSS